MITMNSCYRVSIAYVPMVCHTFECVLVIVCLGVYFLCTRLSLVFHICLFVGTLSCVFSYVYVSRLKK